uniref:ADP,ATP carrier protein n=1 Tax=Aplanochytrium stocchinoi TaxID=215587 RepID=A0A7S3PHQ4_9STRA|mmetsp:Transcript_17270/g.22039  ORF Transcript_17270/g.22039 Transcript_17270/m.22039 type:complete len:419 (-) Transcript_17270:880-2136(-)
MVTQHSALKMGKESLSMSETQKGSSRRKTGAVTVATVATLTASFVSATSRRNRLTLYHTLFSRTTFASAVAGCMGSVAAMALCYPLERVRTIAQLKRNGTSNSVYTIIKEIVNIEGWGGLYFGLRPVLIALGTSNFVYFYFYSLLKVLYQGLRKQNGELSGLANLLIASIAGSLNVLITTPLWVVVTRLSAQMKKRSVEKINSKCELISTLAVPSNNDSQNYSSLSDGLMRIAKEEGISELWSGTMASLILVSNPSVQFASYERLKRWMLSYKFGVIPSEENMENLEELINNVETMDVPGDVSLENPDLNSYDYLILGAAAKMIATLVTYPLQIAQAKMRADAGKETSHGEIKKTYSGTLDCLFKVFNDEGILGLYKGMDAKLLQTCLTSAFMFAFYEKIYSFIFRLMVRRRLTSTST